MSNVADQSHAFSVRRITVAIDNSSQLSDTLSLAAWLARQLESELEGLFVEDISLARLAKLPVAREVCIPNGMGRDFNARALRIQNREQAAVVRSAIASAAGAAQVEHTFRITRGKVDDEMIAAADQADLLVMGTGHSPLRARSRLGRTALAAAGRCRRSILIVKRDARTVGHQFVCFDGSPEAYRALHAALRISGSNPLRMTVLIVGADQTAAAALHEEAEAWLRPHGAEPKFLQRVAPGPDEICELAAQTGADLLVIPARTVMATELERARLLNTAECPVLLVR